MKTCRFQTYSEMMNILYTFRKLNVSRTSPIYIFFSEMREKNMFLYIRISMSLKSQRVNYELKIVFQLLCLWKMSEKSPNKWKKYIQKCINILCTFLKLNLSKTSPIHFFSPEMNEKNMLLYLRISMSFKSQRVNY